MLSEQLPVIAVQGLSGFIHCSFILHSKWWLEWWKINRVINLSFKAFSEQVLFALAYLKGRSDTVIMPSLLLSGWFKMFPSLLPFTSWLSLSGVSKMDSSNLDWEAFLEGFGTKRMENEGDVLEGKEVGDFSDEKRQAKNQRKLLCRSNSCLIGGRG